MKLALIPFAAAALLAGCASSDPATRAAMACDALARSEGLTVEQSRAQAAGDGHQVTLRLVDRVGRRVDASCTVADGKPSWAQPLPTGLATR